MNPWRGYKRRSEQVSHISGGTAAEEDFWRGRQRGTETKYPGWVFLKLRVDTFTPDLESKPIGIGTLTASAINSDEYYIFTCSCGVPECAGDSARSRNRTRRRVGAVAGSRDSTYAGRGFRPERISSRNIIESSSGFGLYEEMG
jgi:hypothetical protein